MSLSNLEDLNLCYANAPLQLIVRCPIIRLHLLTQPIEHKTIPYLLREYIVLLNLGGAHSCQHIIIEIVATVKGIGKFVKIGEESCAHEFYQKLLELLIADMPELKEKLQLGTSAIGTCNTCQTKTVSGEPLSSSFLSMSAPEYYTFEKAWDAYATDRIDGFKCDTCTGKNLLSEEYIKYTVTTAVPECLFVSITDFRYDVDLMRQVPVQIEKNIVVPEFNKQNISIPAPLAPPINCQEFSKNKIHSK